MQIADMYTWVMVPMHSRDPHLVAVAPDIHGVAIALGGKLIMPGDEKDSFTLPAVIIRGSIFSITLAERGISFYPYK